MMWVGKTSINLIFLDERLLNANCCSGFFVCNRERWDRKKGILIGHSVLKWVNVDILKLFANDIPIFYVKGSPGKK